MEAKLGVYFVTLGRHRRIEPERRRWCVCVCMHACLHACARECVCVCVRLRAFERVNACVRVCACVRAYGSACVCDVFAIYDNNISPRLIMIIIKI